MLATSSERLKARADVNIAAAAIWPDSLTVETVFFCTT
jgi:hypothetical protein